MKPQADEQTTRGFRLGEPDRETYATYRFPRVTGFERGIVVSDFATGVERRSPIRIRNIPLVTSVVTAPKALTLEA
jgi:hypothetical protein